MISEKNTMCQNGLLRKQHYPTPYIAKSRCGRINKTSDTQKKYNLNQALWKLSLCIFANFNITDFSLRITFPTEMSDTERIENIKRFIRKLRKLYADIGIILRYIYVIGRGEVNNNIHVHLLANRIQRKYIDNIEKIGAEFGLTIRVRTIKNNSTDSKINILQRTAKYLFGHYKILTDDDKMIIKHSFYPSQNLIRPVEEINNVDPHTLNRLSKAYQHGELSAQVEKEYPELNAVSEPQLWYDDMGRAHFSCLFEERKKDVDT